MNPFPALHCVVRTVATKYVAKITTLFLQCGNGIFTHHHPCNASGFVMHVHNKSFTVHYAYTIALTVHVLKWLMCLQLVHNQLIIHAKCLLVTTIHVASVYM